MNGKMGVKEMRRDTPPDTPPGPVWTLRTVLWFTYSEREKKSARSREKRPNGV